MVPMRLGEVDLATALSAAHALYGQTFNPEVTLKALSYFDDGNLRDLPNDLKRNESDPGNTAYSGYCAADHLVRVCHELRSPRRNAGYPPLRFR